jgi:hypothetical protein
LFNRLKETVIGTFNSLNETVTETLVENYKFFLRTVKTQYG